VHALRNLLWIQGLTQKKWGHDLAVWRSAKSASSVSLKVSSTQSVFTCMWRYCSSMMYLNTFGLDQLTLFHDWHDLVAFARLLIATWAYNSNHLHLLHSFVQAAPFYWASMVSGLLRSIYLRVHDPLRYAQSWIIQIAVHTHLPLFWVLEWIRLNALHDIYNTMQIWLLFAKWSTEQTCVHNHSLCESKGTVCAVAQISLLYRFDETIFTISYTHTHTRSWYTHTPSHTHTHVHINTSTYTYMVFLNVHL